MTPAVLTHHRFPMRVLRGGCVTVIYLSAKLRNPCSVQKVMLCFKVKPALVFCDLKLGILEGPTQEVPDSFQSVGYIDAIREPIIAAHKRDVANFQDSQNRAFAMYLVSLLYLYHNCSSCHLNDSLGLPMYNQISACR